MHVFCKYHTTAQHTQIVLASDSRARWHVWLDSQMHALWLDSQMHALSLRVRITLTAMDTRETFSLPSGVVEQPSGAPAFLRPDFWKDAEVSSPIAL